MQSHFTLKWNCPWSEFPEIPLGKKLHAKPLQQMFLNAKVREEPNCFQDYIIRKDSQSERNINKNKRVLRTQAENCLLAIIPFIFVMCLSVDTFIPKGYSIFMVEISYKEYGILFQWKVWKHTLKIQKIIFWCWQHWTFISLVISAIQWSNSRRTKILVFQINSGISNLSKNKQKVQKPIYQWEQETYEEFT